MRRTPAAPSLRNHVRLRFSQLFWLGVSFAGYAWLFELLQSLADFDTAAELIAATATSLFSSLLVGAVLGTLLGLFWTGTFGGEPPSQVLARQLLALAGLRSWTAEQKRYWTTRMYAAAALSGAGAWVSFIAIRELVISIATPGNVALAVVATEFGILAGMLAAFRPCCCCIGAIVTRWPARGAAMTLLDPRLHAVVLLAIGCSVAASLMMTHWTVLQALPWSSMALLLGAAVCGSVTLHALYRLNSTVRGIIGGAVASSFALSGVWGAWYGPTVATYHANTNRGPLSRLGHAWLDTLLDFDRDAHSSWFGGRDCAPFNPRIHPGAVEIPGNASDENCDGVAAKHAIAIAGGTHRHVLPDAWRDPPDLYLITIDAFATSVLASYGGTSAAAPNLDRLAARAVVFENYFVQGPSTRLSLPSMFTSRFDSQIDRLLVGRFPFELLESNLMVAEVLAEAGYSTRAVLPHPYFTKENWRGLTQGFAEVDTEPARSHSAEWPHTARKVTAGTVEFIRRAREWPLFVWAHYFDAHPPHQLPQGSRRLSEGEEGEEEAYAAEVSLIDQQIALVMQEIEARGRNHVVLVTGDHGIAFDHPRHTTVHYGHDLSTMVLQVPLLIYSPRLEARRVDALASGLDLAPTLANLAGVTRQLPFLGHSLVPFLLGQPANLPEVRFAQLYIGEDVFRGKDPLRVASARTQRFNMVLDRRTGIVQAWNWRIDRQERQDLWQPLQAEAAAKNVASAESYQSELNSLRATLEAFVYQSHGASPSKAQQRAARLSAATH